MIGIISYGVGNVNAIHKLCSDNLIVSKVVSTISDLDNCTHFILPGVGHFDHAMELFTSSVLYDVVSNLVLEQHIPILGICVGMQMLATSSEEGTLPGLNWIPGTVKSFSSNIDFPYVVPHMGWNNLNIISNDKLLSYENDYEFYFLHSFYFEPADTKFIVSTTSYGFDFASVVRNKNIIGMQCHPEKSHDNGVSFIKSFSEFKYVKT